VAAKIRSEEQVPAPDGFDEIMPKTLATATVDRLLHHAHLCQTSGESVRLSQALTGRGVKALT
jgi:DNA replication protein DnaC